MDKISRTSRMEGIKRRRKIGQAKQWRNGIAEPRSGRSDGEGERERWRGGALVFGCMFLKQTPVCRNSLQFADNTRILEITIRHPYFYNTEILLR